MKSSNTSFGIVHCTSECVFIEGPKSFIMVKEHPRRRSAPYRREGFSNNLDKSGQGKGGGVVVSGHPF